MIVRERVGAEFEGRWRGTDAMRETGEAFMQHFALAHLSRKLIPRLG
jgi:hypothetical protein